jgi:hypothetical protein
MMSSIQIRSRWGWDSYPMVHPSDAVGVKIVMDDP